MSVNATQDHQLRASYGGPFTITQRCTAKERESALRLLPSSPLQGIPALLYLTHHRDHQISVALDQVKIKPRAQRSP